MSISQAIWYLWSVNGDPTTNKYLVQVIGEHELKNRYCADGQRRNLFRCPQGYDNVRVATAAIPDLGLKLEVFKEEVQGPNARRIARYVLQEKSVRKEVTKSNYLRRSYRRRFSSA